MRRQFALILIVIITGCASHGPLIDAGPFETFADPLGAVEASIDRAGEEGKLALVVLGGNWCHDSKALNEAFDDPALASVLAEKYVTTRMSVGYLALAQDVAERYDPMGIYLHTPTVLIIDPVRRVTINASDNVQFRDAAKLSVEDVTSYFERYGQEKAGALPNASAGSALYKARLDAISRDVRAPQVARIAAAYRLIGPRLERRSKDLNDYWRPVQKLRYQLADDILRLTSEVSAYEMAGRTDFSAYPVYTPFEWE